MPRCVTRSDQAARDRAELLEPVRRLGQNTVAFEKARQPGRLGDRQGPAGRPLPEPHWGFLFSGKIVVHFDDRTETIEGGRAYYITPGHAIEFLEDSEALSSPTAALERTFAQVGRNAASALDWVRPTEDRGRGGPLQRRWLIILVVAVAALWCRRRPQAQARQGRQPGWIGVRPDRCRNSANEGSPIRRTRTPLARPRITM